MKVISDDQYKCLRGHLEAIHNIIGSDVMAQGTFQPEPEQKLTPQEQRKQNYRDKLE